MREKQVSTGSMKKALVQLSTFANNLRSAQETAESRHNQFCNLDGLHNWTPIAAKEKSEVSCAFTGFSSKTCLVTSFTLTEPDRVTCSARIDPKLFRERKCNNRIVAKHTSLTSSFIDANMESILKTVNQSILSSPSDIGSLLQRLGWEIGRLEMTANELRTLQSRYVASLEAAPLLSKAKFLFSVEFKHRKKSAELKASFELVDSYPFTPLNVSLDTVTGNVDVDALRRQLIKNSKPGFGYLSRACDVIAAFVSEL